MIKLKIIMRQWMWATRKVNNDEIQRHMLARYFKRLILSYNREAVKE